MKLTENERVTRQLAKKVGVRFGGTGWSKTSADGVSDGISMMMGSGYWNEDVHGKVERFATSFGMITAERYLETLERVLHPNGDPDIAARQIDQAYTTSLDVYRRAGKAAGAYFLLSYPMITDPEGFRDQVISAKDSGGPHFASWYAYYTPDALVAGVPMDHFKTGSSIVRHNSSLKYAKEFMKLTPEGTGLMGFSDFTDTALDANERLDQHSAFNALLPIVAFGQELGVQPQDVIGDFTDHTEKYGEKSAGWYSYGVRTIAQEAQRQRNFRLHQPTRRADQIDIKDTLSTYKSSYASVLESAGLTTAVFFARHFTIGAPDVFAKNLLDIRSKLPRKIFNKALWVMSNWRNLKSLREPIEVLQEIVDMTDYLPEKEVMDTLNFTLGLVRQKKNASGLVNPHEPFLHNRGSRIYSEEPDISDFPTREEFQDTQSEVAEENPFLPNSDTIYVHPRVFWGIWEPKDSEAEDNDFKDPYDAMLEIEAERRRKRLEEIERWHREWTAQQQASQAIQPVISKPVHLDKSKVEIVDYPTASNERSGQMTVWELPKNG